MPPNPTIKDVIYPSQATSGERVAVRVPIHNVGDAGYCAVNVVDGDTGNVYSKSSFYLYTCTTFTYVAYVTMPSRDLKLTVKVGVAADLAGNISRVTDSRSFTVKYVVEAVPPKPTILKVYAPSEASVGDWVTVTFTVKNEGGSGTVGVQLVDLDTGTVWGSKIVELASGQTYTSSFRVQMPNRDWRLELRTLVDTKVFDREGFTIPLAAAPTIPPNFKFIGVDYPSTATPGAVTIRFTVENVGGEGSALIILRDATTGLEIDSTTLTLGSRDIRSGSFTLTLYKTTALRLEAWHKNVKTDSVTFTIKVLAYATVKVHFVIRVTGGTPPITCTYTLSSANKGVLQRDTVTELKPGDKVEKTVYYQAGVGVEDVVTLEATLSNQYGEYPLRASKKFTP